MANVNTSTEASFARRAQSSTRFVIPGEVKEPLFNLATLQINFAVVGLVVLAAFLTKPNDISEEQYGFEAHTGQQLVVRPKVEPLVPTLVTLSEENQHNEDESHVVVDDPVNIEPAKTTTIEDIPAPVKKPKKSSVQARTVASVSEEHLEPLTESLPMVSVQTNTPSQAETGYIDKDVLPQNNEEIAAGLYNSAVNVLNEGRYAEAEDSLKSLSKKFPQYTKATELLAAIYLEQGKTEDAINILEIYTRKSPSDLRLKKWLVKLYIDNNQNEKAIDLTQSMLSKKLAAENVVLLASLYQQSGQPEDAKNLYRTAIELGGGDFKVWLGYALTLELLGETESARQAYIAAQNLNSNIDVSGFIKSRIDILTHDAKS